MMNIQRSLLGLISTTVLLGGTVCVSASTKVTYVRVNSKTIKEAVYKQIAKTVHQVKVGYQRQGSANQVYRVVQRRK